MEPAKTHSPPLLEVNDISKRFGPVKALDRVSFSLSKGEILALCGENGAGKSTIVKILMGLQQPDDGSISINGRRETIDNPRIGQSLGIALVSQELSLAPELSVLDNIWLGSSRVGFLHKQQALRQRAEAVVDRLGFTSDILDRPVWSLSIAERQLVEIARNLCRDARILILDEPTATLSDSNIECLFSALNRLSQDGVGIIYITHRLNEVFELCDRVTVLRNGMVVGGAEMTDIDKPHLVRLMIGTDLHNIYPPKRISGLQKLQPSLVVNRLSIKDKLKDISFEVEPGEILGIAGQIGSGAAELVRAIAGLIPAAQAQLRLHGNEISLRSRSTMSQLGFDFVSEDRALEGIFLDRPVWENLTAVQLSCCTPFGLFKRQSALSQAQFRSQKVGVDHRRFFHSASTLSGGNQQKLAFGRCLREHGESSTPRVLLMCEPTRGVDVGARADLYQLMREFSAQGYALILHTTDIEELLGMSDRIITLYRGASVNHYSSIDFNAEQILLDITNATIQ